MSKQRCMSLRVSAGFTYHSCDCCRVTSDVIEDTIRKVLSNDPTLKVANISLAWIDTDSVMAAKKED